MNDLLLHPDTRLNLDAYLLSPPHAVLLAGESGVGLFTIAHRLAEKMAGQSSALIIKPDEKGTISIDVVHDLYVQTRSRRAGGHMAVIIDDAELMSLPAQNSLLKLLEEPVEGVHFLLTSHHPE